MGKELYADGTLVEANADRDKMLPRFAVEAHLQQLLVLPLFMVDNSVSAL